MWFVCYLHLNCARFHSSEEQENYNRFLENAELLRSKFEPEATHKDFKGREPLTNEEPKLERKRKRSADGVANTHPKEYISIKRGAIKRKPLPVQQSTLKERSPSTDKVENTPPNGSSFQPDAMNRRIKRKPLPVQSSTLSPSTYEETHKSSEESSSNPKDITGGVRNMPIIPDDNAESVPKISKLKRKRSSSSDAERPAKRSRTRKVLNNMSSWSWWKKKIGMKNEKRTTRRN